MTGVCHKIYQLEIVQKLNLHKEMKKFIQKQFQELQITKTADTY